MKILQNILNNAIIVENKLEDNEKSFSILNELESEEENHNKIMNNNTNKKDNREIKY